MGGPHYAGRLWFEEGSFTAPGSPKRAHDNFALIEGVVDVAGNFLKVNASKTDDASPRVRRARAGENCQDVESLFELRGEDIYVSPVLKPPGLLAPDVLLRSW